MGNVYDTIIIGSGPAGMTAAIYAARRELKALVIGKELGGQVVWASSIENYPGFLSIESFDLITKMREQVKKVGVEIVTGEVEAIAEQKDKIFLLKAGSKEYKTKTIIACLGMAPRKLGVPGEKELNGKGVSYCANCDGPFFKGKIVAVVGGGNAALDAAEILSKIASKVYLIHRQQEFRGFEYLINEVKGRKNIELVLDSKIKEIIGANKVEKIIVENIKAGGEREIITDGVLVEIGRVANTEILENFADLDPESFIIVDKNQMTKTKGIFAAGDFTNGSNFKQIIIAAAQGSIAALGAYQYLQIEEDKK
ncbi:MAG: FAD-dependent oxidoreductase [Patescibacteria group bacterium]|nr:FAD-dependent oxidoreductase [Patescibacteria group bacterium]